MVDSFKFKNSKSHNKLKSLLSLYHSSLLISPYLPTPSLQPNGSLQGLASHAITSAPTSLNKKKGLGSIFFNSKKEKVEIGIMKKNLEIYNLSNFIRNNSSLPATKFKKTFLYYNLVKGFIGRPITFHNQLIQNSKIITYSFNRINNYYNFLSNTNSIHKKISSIFLSMASLISRPIFIIRQDKIIVRLLLFLSPKVEKFFLSNPKNKTSWNIRNKYRGSISSYAEPSFTLRPAEAQVLKSSIIKNRLTGSFPLSQSKTNYYLPDLLRSPNTGPFMVRSGGQGGDINLKFKDYVSFTQWFKLYSFSLLKFKILTFSPFD